MSMLQVRNLPEDLHTALAERARAEGVSMSEYVTRVLRRDLSRPTMREWTEHVRSASAPRVELFDAASTLDEVRIEYSPPADATAAVSTESPAW